MRPSVRSGRKNHQSSNSIHVTSSRDQTSNFGFRPTVSRKPTASWSSVPTRPASSSLSLSHLRTGCGLQRLRSHGSQDGDGWDCTVETDMRKTNRQDSLAPRRDRASLGLADPACLGNHRWRAGPVSGGAACGAAYASRSFGLVSPRTGLAPSTPCCGTLGAIGGNRPAERFEMELDDPVLGRTMRHAYAIDCSPVVS
jgi:Protein of unknown function (DUF2848)